MIIIPSDSVRIVSQKLSCKSQPSRPLTKIEKGLMTWIEREQKERDGLIADKTKFENRQANLTKELSQYKNGSHPIEQELRDVHRTIFKFLREIGTCDVRIKEFENQLSKCRR